MRKITSRNLFCIASFGVYTFRLWFFLYWFFLHSIYPKWYVWEMSRVFSLNKFFLSFLDNSRNMLILFRNFLDNTPHSKDILFMILMKIFRIWLFTKHPKRFLILKHRRNMIIIVKVLEYAVSFFFTRVVFCLNSKYIIKVFPSSIC